MEYLGRYPRGIRVDKYCYVLASEVTPGLQQEQSLIPISFMSRFVYIKGDQMEVNSEQYRFNSEPWTRLCINR
jgi:hypothetical protein